MEIVNVVLVPVELWARIIDALQSGSYASNFECAEVLREIENQGMNING